MLTKTQEPPEASERPAGPRSEFIAIASSIAFWLALLMMCICEAVVIHGLWFKRMPPVSTAKLFTYPTSILIPGLLGLALRAMIKKKAGMGELSPRIVTSLDQLLSILILFTYIAMLNLAGLAF